MYNHRAVWRKSTYSGSQANCVEVGHAPDLVQVRDSKLGDSSLVLAFGADAWAAFTGTLR